MLYGEPNDSTEKPVSNGANKVEIRKYKLEKCAEGMRLTIPKEHIADGVWGIEVLPSFMKAVKGDEGYWMSARGMYGYFDKDNGGYRTIRSVMPIYAMKRGDNLWWGHIKKWRFDYYFIARATEGKYETVLRFRADGVRKYFDLYDDIVIDYHCLKGKEATYANIAKAYQKYQLENSGVKTIKERIKEQPELDYLTESIVVRIQTHCAKPIADISTKSPERVKADFTAETEYPLEVHMPLECQESLCRQSRIRASIRQRLFLLVGIMVATMAVRHNTFRLSNLSAVRLVFADSLRRPKASAIK